MLGSIPQPELAALMSRSHVLALPSIEEGLALVQAQAMACGCPVVCSTNTGGEDLFTDGVEGFIVPIRDPIALADACSNSPTTLHFSVRCARPRSGGYSLSADGRNMATGGKVC